MGRKNRDDSKVWTVAVPIDFGRADELTDWIKANLTTLKTVYREPPRPRSTSTDWFWLSAVKKRLL